MVFLCFGKFVISSFPFFTGMFHVWPIMRRCTVIARKEVFYVWPLGLAAWLAGLIYIPRTNAEKSKEIMSEACESIKVKKVSNITVLDICLVKK